MVELQYYLMGGYNMPVSKKQQACVARYTKEHYDEIKIRIKKGEKAKLQELAESEGLSLNAFLNKAISAYINIKSDN